MKQDAKIIARRLYGLLRRGEINKIGIDEIREAIQHHGNIFDYDAEQFEIAVTRAVVVESTVADTGDVK